jgi:hypothetical protein
MDRGRVGEDRGSKETDGCPLTICHMTVNEQDEFIKQMMADHDAAIVALGEASTVSEVTVIEHEVSEGDFVRSSRYLVCPCY